MQTLLTLIALTLCSSAAFPQDPGRLEQDLKEANSALRDWPDLKHYRAENARTPPPTAGVDRVVFLGDSITRGWGKPLGRFFPGKPYLNRGISGQTTPQLLIRFRPDVIALHPKVVVILAGTNDLAGNTGPTTLEAIEDNFMSMCELAQANRIRVVLSSVLPVSDYLKPQSDTHPPQQIRELNAWLKSYSAAHGHVYLDYYSSMLDDAGVLKRELTRDGLHPSAAGYEVMMPLAEKAIADALAK